MKRLLSTIPLLLLTSSFGCQITIPSRSGVVIGGPQLGHEAQRVETHALKLAPEDVLSLITSYGSVEVTGASTGAPELKATVRARGRTQAEAEQVLARYELKIEHRPDGPHAELVGEPLRLHEGSTHLELSAQVDFVATVPLGTGLTASSGSGDLVTRGALGALRLTTGYGSIRIDEARGDVHAKSGSGDVEAAKLDGGEVELESGYGTVRVQNARARRVKCESGSGDIRIDAASAESLDLETGYGSVHVDQAGGAVRAASGSGDVRLRGVAGPVEAKSGYGAVEIDGVLASVEASSGSGDVRVRARAGSRVDPSWTATSSYGEVVLEVPADFACTLDARTGYGNVECDFPVTIEAGKKKRGDSKLAGKIGSGGGTVTLSSGSGDVALKKQ
jgi:DUF4097 and DUF4098 domain-containing protein YvlB